MGAVYIGYASYHGHAKAVAERVAAHWTGGPDRVLWADLRHRPPQPPERVPVLVVASVHQGRLDRTVRRWLTAHASHLETVPTGLLTVSLTAHTAYAPDQAAPHRTAWAREEARRTLGDLRAQLAAETGFEPNVAFDVAGALSYRRYGWWLRRMMRRIAQDAHLPTDMNKDHVLTDYEALDRFVRDVVGPAFSLVEASGAGPFARAA